MKFNLHKYLQEDSEYSSKRLISFITLLLFILVLLLSEFVLEKEIRIELYYLLSSMIVGSSALTLVSSFKKKQQSQEKQEKQDVDI